MYTLHMYTNRQYIHKNIIQLNEVIFNCMY